MIEDIAEEITETDLSKLKRLGIDEIALVKGQKNYCAVLVNLDTGKLIAIGWTPEQQQSSSRAEQDRRTSEFFVLVLTWI